MYHSDWHIHTNASYDARNSMNSTPIPYLLKAAEAQGIKRLGITDHANINTKEFKADIRYSRLLYEAYKREGLYFGVEFTPVGREEYEYADKYGTMEGYTPPAHDNPQDIELALTKDEMDELGIQYAIGASHWTLNVPLERDLLIREWFRQQMYLACDERIDILGHPWYMGSIWNDPKYPRLNGVWFEDFGIIPKSMHDELASALLSRDCAVEINRSMIQMHDYGYTDKFRWQYMEFIRYLFERGVRITYGSDNHQKPYSDNHDELYPILRSVGFKEGDFSEPHFHNL